MILMDTRVQCDAVRALPVWLVPAFGEASEALPWASRLRGPRAYAGKKWKISKIAATKTVYCKDKCTKFDFRWSFAPDPFGDLTALPQSH